MKPAVVSRPAPSQRQLRTIFVVIGVIVVLVGVKLLFFTYHENAFEKIAREVTVALQANDLATVQKYQNAETATQVNRQRVGRAADALAPLGKLKEVRETAVDPDSRTHQFELSFDKGGVHETIKFDPANKIVRFRYDPPTPK